MSAPTEIQFQQLKRLLSKLNTAIPIDCRQKNDGSVQVDAGNPYVIRDSGDMDSFLSQFMDINTNADPDDLFDNFREMLDSFADS